MVAETLSNPMVRELARGKLHLVTTTTLENSLIMVRISTLMDSGAIYDHLGRGKLNPKEDRVMICGSMAMLKDIKDRVEAEGFIEGANSAPGDFVIERAFVN
jgi:ferredoxin--NADP+ reductase